MQAFLAAQGTTALRPDEILRAEWVARVAALDLYIHELVAQRMVAIFEGKLPLTPAYQVFRIPTETLDRIRRAISDAERTAAFDLEVRRQLGLQTFQEPDRVADALRLCSTVELWNAIAVKQGATEQNKVQAAKALKMQLAIIVGRRNKIAHEADLQPTVPKVPWPISQSDLASVAAFIRSVVHAIDSCIT